MIPVFVGSGSGKSTDGTGDEMNIRRGLFRTWVVLSVLFIIVVAIFGWRTVEDEFQKAAFLELIKGDITLVPLFCEDARGKLNEDYTLEPGRTYVLPKEKCWYEMPKLRALYPEFKAMTDDELVDKTYKKVGQKLTPVEPWWTVASLSAFALAIPLLFLALGSAIYWALAGFGGHKQA
jgi:peptidoglycan/LPS O-acetylase OafA/YrhL